MLKIIVKRTITVRTSVGVVAVSISPNLLLTYLCAIH